jgi:hypothetical protein
MAPQATSLSQVDSSTIHEASTMYQTKNTNSRCTNLGMQSYSGLN